MTDVTHNKTDNTFEIVSDEGTAFVEYVLDGNEIRFTHTEVPPALEGRGIGSKLAKAALEHAKEKGLTVVPLCAFIAAYVKRHGEYDDLVHADYRGK